MHTMKCAGGIIILHHGDYNGEAIFSPVDVDEETNSAHIPVKVLEAFVAEKLRHKKIAALEQATPEELLKGFEDENLRDRATDALVCLNSQTDGKDDNYAKDQQEIMSLIYDLLKYRRQG